MILNTSVVVFSTVGRTGYDTVVRAHCSVSRLYEYGACVGDRQNQFNSYPDCSSRGGAVTSVDTETCRRVFAGGAHLAVLFHGTDTSKAALDKPHHVHSAA